MKIVRRISLFLVLAGVLLGAGGYAAIRAEQFFYPNRYPVQEKTSPQEETQTEQIIETSSVEIPVITADTTYLIENINLSEGSVEEIEDAIPVKYIGLNREELLKELNAYDKNPPLTELEKGFETIELTAFSKDRVVICKYYKEEEPKSFYLMVADHFVVVYEADKKTLYLNTDILLDSLEDSLQAEIIQGKYVENEEALYNFLESYSS